MSVHAIKYDVVMELKNAPSSVTFGQLIGNDDVEAKIQLRPIVTGRNVTVG